MAVTMCECGCGEPAPVASFTDRARGYEKGKPRRFVNGHQNRGRISSLRRKHVLDERYFSIEDKGYKTPCWVWKRATVGERGYGQVSVCGKKVVAHRAVWEERIGPWPAGLQADHLCRVRLCVNPDHIEPVTQSVNQRRGRGAKLDEIQIARMANLYSSGKSVRALARMFGVTRDTVMRHLRIGGRHGLRTEAL